jgi:hypothetical protein
MSPTTLDVEMISRRGDARHAAGVDESDVLATGSVDYVAPLQAPFFWHWCSIFF